MKRWLNRLPPGTREWSCPWFLTVVIIGTAAVVVTSYEGLSLLSASSGFIVGFVLGARAPHEGRRC